MEKMMRPKESEIQSAIIQYLKLKGWFVIKNVTYSQTIYATKGIPDLVAVKKAGSYARTLWIEVKSKGRLQSENQKLFQENLEKQKGEYILASSVEDVMRYLGKKKEEALLSG